MKIRKWGNLCLSIIALGVGQYAFARSLEPDPTFFQMILPYFQWGAAIIGAAGLGVSALTYDPDARLLGRACGVLGSLVFLGVWLYSYWQVIVAGLALVAFIVLLNFAEL